MCTATHAFLHRSEHDEVQQTEHQQGEEQPFQDAAEVVFAGFGGDGKAFVFGQAAAKFAELLLTFKCRRYLEIEMGTVFGKASREVFCVFSEAVLFDGYLTPVLVGDVGEFFYIASRNHLFFKYIQLALDRIGLRIGVGDIKSTDDQQQIKPHRIEDGFALHRFAGFLFSVGFVGCLFRVCRGHGIIRSLRIRF